MDFAEDLRITNDVARTFCLVPTHAAQNLRRRPVDSGGFQMVPQRGAFSLWFVHGGSLSIPLAVVSPFDFELRIFGQGGHDMAQRFSAWTQDKSSDENHRARCIEGIWPAEFRFSSLASAHPEFTQSELLQDAAEKRKSRRDGTPREVSRHVGLRLNGPSDSLPACPLLRHPTPAIVRDERTERKMGLA